MNIHFDDPEALLLPRPSLMLQPVILAGGSGTRLWPLSREQYPKQLIGLLADETLLEATARRLDGLDSTALVADRIILVCGENHRYMSAEQLGRTGKPAHLLLEPATRNTAPALTVAALAASANGSDSIMVVMPADHAVPDTDAFKAAVLRAAAYAADRAVVTLGVVPRHAETGYGYIKVGAQVGEHGGRAVDRFVEKPDQELAQRYVQSGEYWWNSGIFVVRVSVWLSAIAALCPEIFNACDSAFSAATLDGAFLRLDPQAFKACPADSIDYAVMEKISAHGSFAAVVVPLIAGWSDIGSWGAMWEVMTKDAVGNAARGRVIFEDTASSLAHSEGRLIVCLGLEDMVVVETPDAVLVADKQHMQQVKTVVNRLKAEHGLEEAHSRKVHRPWGYYDSIDSGERFQVKRIVVNPGTSLSLQMHYHRAEHWIVVRGTAKVICGEEVFLLTENQSTFIPLGTAHRLENPGRTPLEIIEVQSGAYLGEDDIVRFEDNHGRVKAKVTAL
jgi:mannose-1-phosphate guanylyltransferase / mannose-6-phosphate isomerase